MANVVELSVAVLVCLARRAVECACEDIVQREMCAVLLVSHHKSVQDMWSPAACATVVVHLARHNVLTTTNHPSPQNGRKYVPCLHRPTERCRVQSSEKQTF